MVVILKPHALIRHNGSFLDFYFIGAKIGGNRVWDATTGAHLDKDLFRRNMGGEADAYQEVMKRLLG